MPPAGRAASRSLGRTDLFCPQGGSAGPRSSSDPPQPPGLPRGLLSAQQYPGRSPSAAPPGAGSGGRREKHPGRRSAYLVRVRAGGVGSRAAASGRDHSAMRYGAEHGRQGRAGPGRAGRGGEAARSRAPPAGAPPSPPRGHVSGLTQAAVAGGRRAGTPPAGRGRRDGCAPPTPAPPEAGRGRDVSDRRGLRGGPRHPQLERLSAVPRRSCQVGAGWTNAA